MLKKQQRRSNIRYRIRKTVKGTAERPRLSVFRSNKQIYAQLIDDVQGVTLAAVSSAAKEMTATKGPKVDLAREVGTVTADEVPGLVAKLSERTYGIAQKYNYLFQK